MSSSTPPEAGAPTTSADDDLIAWAAEQIRSLPHAQEQAREEEEAKVLRVLDEITVYCEGGWDRDANPVIPREVVRELLGEGVPEDAGVPDPSVNQTLRRQLLEEHYGWTPETIKRFRLGFDDGGLYAHLRAVGLDDERVLLSGHFYPPKNGKGPLRSRFEGRLVFPFVDEHGITRYFAARATTRTRRWQKRDKDGEPVMIDGNPVELSPPKYLKSKLHRELTDEQKAAGAVPDGISPHLKNDCIYNAVDGTKPTDIGVVAEGAADLISIAQAGWHVISPAAVTFRSADADRLLDLTRKWGITVLVPDQEANGAGVAGATKTADALFKGGRDVRIAVLPDEHVKAEARARVDALRARAKKERREPTEDELATAGNWKIDANEFLAATHDIKKKKLELEEALGALRAAAAPDDEPLLREARAVAKAELSTFKLKARAEAVECFRSLVLSALPYIDYRIAALPVEVHPSKLDELLGPVISLIATRTSAAERDAYLQRLRAFARIDNLREMLAAATSKLDAEADDEDEPSAMDTLADLIGATGPFRIATGRVFARFDGQLFPVDGEAFLCGVAAKFKKMTRGYMSKNAFEKVMLTVLGSSLPVGRAPIRYADDNNGGILVDLAAGTGKAVHITAGGISVIESPVAFFRPEGTLPLPVPAVPANQTACIATLTDYYKELVGLSDEHGKACCFAFQLCSMVPMEWTSKVIAPDALNDDELTNYPGLNVTGPKGSGKTTLVRAIMKPIDPRRPDVMALPKTTDDLAILAENGHILAFDNLSAMTTELSDALCRLSTGDGLKKRSLYTNRDLTVFRGSRPVACTGIVDFAKQPDLLDRQLLLRLGLRTARLTKAALAEKSHGIQAAVFGAFCYCAHRALGADVPAPTEDIRMVDAVMFAAGAERLAGLPAGAVFRAFEGSRDEADRLAAEDPIVEVLQSVLLESAMFEGSTGELLDRLTEARRGSDGKKPLPRDWPKSARGLTAALRRLEPTLRSLGVTIKFPTGTGGGEDGKKRVLVITQEGGVALSPTPTAAPAPNTTPLGDEHGFIDWCAPPTTVPTIPPTIDPTQPSDARRSDPGVPDDPSVPTIDPAFSVAPEEGGVEAEGGGTGDRDHPPIATSSPSLNSEEKNGPSGSTEPSEQRENKVDPFRRSVPTIVGTVGSEPATDYTWVSQPLRAHVTSVRIERCPLASLRDPEATYPYGHRFFVEFETESGRAYWSHWVTPIWHQEQLDELLSLLGWRGERTPDGQFVLPRVPLRVQIKHQVLPGYGTVLVVVAFVIEGIEVAA